MPWHLNVDGISRVGGAWITSIIVGMMVLRGACSSLLRMGRPQGVALCSALPQSRQGEPLLHIIQHLSLLGAWLGRPGVQPTGPLAGWLPLQSVPSPSASKGASTLPGSPVLPGPSPLNWSPVPVAMPNGSCM